MQFTVLPVRGRPPSDARSECFLIRDNWDDYTYKTQFYLVFVDEDGARHNIGQVKIGQFGMEDRRRPVVAESFQTLDESLFSLGQDTNYYEALNQMGDDRRDAILEALHDVAQNADLFDEALGEQVTGISLLRFVTRQSVTGQLRRLTTGGVLLTSYSFQYTAPKGKRSRIEPVTLSFKVEPESEPPTNIHVLIGRNGVGKTRMLQYMARALVAPRSEDAGSFESFGNLESDLFANLVTVSFSAFDSFEPLPVRKNKSIGLQYSYIGLKRTTTDTPKTPDQLSAEFVQSVLICRSSARSSRWRRALQMLEADPIFAAADITALADEDLAYEGIDDTEDEWLAAFKKDAATLFGRLSSGHKIVLLTITRLVETVVERSLVLLDEPEAHLHPPLLSAFTRSLSDLLMNRNGVAIIATHSPVVLQEVPMTCVWRIRRSGTVTSIDRPETETFGENVGILTRDVFGLEVTQSGFHRLLEEAVRETHSYNALVRRFDGQLGGEARALLRALLQTGSDRNTDR